ncbi:MAG: hypothetical protein ABS951_06795 [Solibacillus sp.]
MEDKQKQAREIMEKAHQERLNVTRRLKEQFEKQISEIDLIEDPDLKMNALEIASKIYKSLY